MKKILIDLPGDKYYAVPRDVLDKYAVPQDKFETELAEKVSKGDTVFHGDVEGQDKFIIRTKSAVMGVRG
jgi:hypothetical protein